MDDKIQSGTRTDTGPQNERRFGILVVDDEPDFCAAISAMFDTARLRFFEAENVVSAFQILSDHGEEIAVVLSDVQMPGGLDGIDLARDLGRRFPRIRIVLMSAAFVQVPDDVRIDGFLRKPFRLKQLMGTFLPLLPPETYASVT